VHALTVGGAALVVNGTTTGSPTNFTNNCGGTAGVVYKVTTTADGTLTITVKAATGSSLVPVLLQQATCGTNLDCTGPTGSQTTLIEDLPAGTYYFIVEGANSTTGAFQLSATLATPKCGDGAVNAGEKCDLGALPPASWQADGCYPPGNAMQCQGVPAMMQQSMCPGQMIAVPKGVNQNLDPMGSTINFPATYSGSCNQMGACPACPGPSRVYNLVPAVSGTMTVDIGYDTTHTNTVCTDDPNSVGCWDMVLFARTACADGTSEIATPDGGTTTGCSDPVFPDAAVIKFPVTAGTSYYVFVVGYDQGTFGSGPYNLFVTLQ
jgi:hypothetical protein